MAVNIQIIKDSTRETVVKLTNDGDAESSVLKVDASTLAGADALASYHELMITNVTWSILSTYSVIVEWDGDTPANALVLNGNGALRYTGGEYVLIKNTAAAPSGDITVSTAGAGAAPAYTVMLTLAKGVGFNRLEATA